MKALVYFQGILALLFFSDFVTQKTSSYRYLPLGDSYTICTGAAKNEAWPVLLCKHLSKQHINCELLANPARNGFSTQDLIDEELPLLKQLKPNFVTLLIGVNDWVREVDIKTYSKNLNYILDEVEKVVPSKKILLITIPDFGVTPQGKNYAKGRDISKGIFDFNLVIKDAAKRRQLPCVDIFELSRAMESDRSLVSADGLHPSGNEYALWEKLILPEAVKLLK